MAGRLEVTALYDGFVDLDTKVLSNASPAEVQRLLTRMFLAGEKVQTAVNAFLINAGGKLCWWTPAPPRPSARPSASSATTSKPPATAPSKGRGAAHPPPRRPRGRHPRRRRQAPVPQRRHPGCPGRPRFLAVRRNRRQGTDGFKPFFKLARDAAAPYQAAGHWKPFSGDVELAPGIKAVDTHGHPGHTAYLVESKGQRLLIIGDVVHSHAVQFARPEVAIEFDSDKKKAVAARKQLFARAAKEKLALAGMHLPFPGLGHVRTEGKGYAWVPVEFSPIRSDK
jgi:hypothetical protein